MYPTDGADGKGHPVQIHPDILRWARLVVAENGETIGEYIDKILRPIVWADRQRIAGLVAAEAPPNSHADAPPDPDGDPAIVKAPQSIPSALPAEKQPRVPALSKTNVELVANHGGKFPREERKTIARKMRRENPWISYAAIGKSLGVTGQTIKKDLADDED